MYVNCDLVCWWVFWNGNFFDVDVVVVVLDGGFYVEGSDWC